MAGSRLPLLELARLCRRVATGVEAGIDDRKIWQREAETGHMQRRVQLAKVSEALSQGSSVAESIARTGDYFPPLFHDMVAAGETSGHLSEVFRRLADHYEHQLRLRRTFVASLVWPITELVIAVAVIGLLIWIMGVVGGADILGWGLTGTSGLIVYLAIVASVGLATVWLIRQTVRGSLWTRSIQHGVLHIPLVGPAFRTMALARCAWTLYLTLDVGLDVRRALTLALKNTRNDYFVRHVPTVLNAISTGQSIHEALGRTGAFPQEMLDAVEIGEDSGRLAESLRRLSDQYQEQSQSSLAILSVIGGYAIWGLVAALIIVLIFRLASFYLDTLNTFAMPGHLP